MTITHRCVKRIFIPTTNQWVFNEHLAGEEGPERSQQKGEPQQAPNGTNGHMPRGRQWVPGGPNRSSSLQNRGFYNHMKQNWKIFKSVKLTFHKLQITEILI